ncbi:hypothetical protein O185_23780 [Photorhabdus temperata J3]|uniref:Uncharacterized protein n=1 Tax=Photorhabdus temperata J3 TaxID=1389415 RepID=U7QRY2_PHOTE|nr:hypothetical protein O185_23780 [Photorhabdus temperata J3]
MIVFIVFNICFLLNLIMMGYCVSRLTNVNHTCFFMMRLSFFPGFKTTLTDKKRFLLTVVLSFSDSELFNVGNYDFDII